MNTVDFDIETLKFDEKGLIPAIVQDFYTKEVLTLPYMNRESLKITLEEKKTCFWSRSRQELWRKGETSGNFQNVVEIKADCDSDALVVLVDKIGPACHTGEESCFFNSICSEMKLSSDGEEDFSLESLYALLLDRKNTLPEGSYTTYLFEKGKEKILKKIGEECTEVVIGAMKEDKAETIYEIADLCYHTMVLMVEDGISLKDVAIELDSRHVIDKKVKQEVMK